VNEIRAKTKHSVFVAAGDLIGASPFLSALFRDELTIESLSRMGLDVSAVGNHEFDKGRDELLRMQNGGCHPVKGCEGPHPFRGARFQYLAASTTDQRTGRPLFPPYLIKEFEGVPVAFIGLTLKGTPDIVVPSGVAGLAFADEADTINALVPQLKARGIGAIVVLIHEGGFPVNDPDQCVIGPIVDIVKKLDKAVDVVVSGHTHRAYICRIDGRLVTSANFYGTHVTRIDIKLDRKTHGIVAAEAKNLLVAIDAYPKDPEQTALIASYDSLARPLASRKVGTVTATLSRAPSTAGESVLGDIIADAQLEATRAAIDGGAMMAFTNPGGVRADIIQKEDGSVTYEDLFACQPFNGSLVTLTLTGVQIKALLEQQWTKPRAVMLYISKGFRYAWDAGRPVGDRVIAEEMTLDGRPIDPIARYRVTVNAFLADGGDGFSVFKEGTERRTGGSDIEALTAYFTTRSPVAPVALDRIRRVN
jgi:5'-nucleotidase